MLINLHINFFRNVKLLEKPWPKMAILTSCFWVIVTWEMKVRQANSHCFLYYFYIKRIHHFYTKGCVHIAKALRCNHSITVLDLRGNNIRNQGCIALAEMIQVNSTLKKWVRSGKQPHICYSLFTRSTNVFVHLLLIGLTWNGIRWGYSKKDSSCLLMV